MLDVSVKPSEGKLTMFIQHYAIYADGSLQFRIAESGWF